MSTSNRLPTPLVLISSVLLLCLGLGFLIMSLPSLSSSRYGANSFGARDFVQYWSAYSAAQAGQNPYDPQVLLEHQQRLGRHDTRPLMMWNPPWTLSILGPVLRLDFSSAARCWFVINVALVMGVALLLSASWMLPHRSLGGFVAMSFFFFPLWENFRLGQLGIVCAFALALLYWSLMRNRPLFVGLALALTTLKPHLFYLVYVVMLYWSLRTRQTGLVIAAFVWLCLAVLSSLWVSPDALAQWLSAISNAGPSPHYTSVVEWRSATVVNLVKDALAGGSWNAARLLLFGVPSLLAAGMWIVLMWRRPHINWAIWLPGLTLISYLGSPYGWVFDQAVLIIPYLATLIIALRIWPMNPLLSLLCISCLLILQPLTWVLSESYLSWQHEFWWFPLPLLVFYAFVLYAQNKPSERNEAVS